jgi:hypothetical protein
VYGEITPLDFVQFALVKYDVKPTTQNTEGGGVWAEHLRWAAPESVALCLGAFTVLVPIWLGAPRPAWRPFLGLHHGVSQNFWGGT